MASNHIIRELDKLIEWRRKPTKLRVDNGPEFVLAAMELWAEKKLTLKFIQKESRTKMVTSNGSIEPTGKRF